MAYATKTYKIKGEDFRVLYNSDKQEIWFQHIPNYEVLGFLSTGSLYIPAGQQGHEDMKDFIIRLKAWLNSMLDKWFLVPDTGTPTPTAPPMDKQIDDLITQQLFISGDKFV